MDTPSHVAIFRGLILNDVMPDNPSATNSMKFHLVLPAALFGRSNSNVICLNPGHAISPFIYRLRSGSLLICCTTLCDKRRKSPTSFSMTTSSDMKANKR